MSLLYQWVSRCSLHCKRAWLKQSVGDEHPHTYTRLQSVQACDKRKGSKKKQFYALKDEWAQVDDVTHTRRLFIQSIFWSRAGHGWDGISSIPYIDIYRDIFVHNIAIPTITFEMLISEHRLMFVYHPRVWESRHFLVFDVIFNAAFLDSVWWHCMKMGGDDMQERL